MNNRIPAEVFPPGEFLKDELEARGWTQDEFAAMVGRPVAVVNQIVSGEHMISAEIAREIALAFGTSVLFWMNLDAEYRRSYHAPTNRII